MADDVEQLEADGPGGSWQIRLAAEHITISRADASQSYQLTKSDTATKLEWQSLTDDQPYFVAHVPKPLVLRLRRGHAAALLGWLGPPPSANLTAVLRRELKWSFLVAAVWLFASLPVSGDETAGVVPIGFDSMAAAIGVMFVVQGALVRWRPHRSLFLLQAAGLVMVAGWCLANAISARYLWPFVLWFAPVGVLLGLAARDVKLFSHFEHTA